MNPHRISRIDNGCISYEFRSCIKDVAVLLTNPSIVSNPALQSAAERIQSAVLGTLVLFCLCPKNPCMLNTETETEARSSYLYYAVLCPPVTKVWTPCQSQDGRIGLRAGRRSIDYLGGSYLAGPCIALRALGSAFPHHEGCRK